MHGIKVDCIPQGTFYSLIKSNTVATFYMWVNLADLPPPINNGLIFFEECIKEKVIVVPGIFFDVNPGKRRDLFNSPCQSYVRLSFGPDMDQIKKGLDAIERVIKKFVKNAPENTNQ